MRGDAPSEIGARRWGSRLPGPSGPDDLFPEAYAASLLEYAAGRLDAHELRAWIVWRLVVDGVLAHEEAEVIAATTIARGRERVEHGDPPQPSSRTRPPARLRRLGRARPAPRRPHRRFGS